MIAARVLGSESIRGGRSREGGGESEDCGRRWIWKSPRWIRASRISSPITNHRCSSTSPAVSASKVVRRESAKEETLKACSLRSTGVCAAHRPSWSRMGSDRERVVEGEGGGGREAGR